MTMRVFNEYAGMSSHGRVSDDLDIYSIFVSMKDFFSYLNVNVNIIIMELEGTKQNAPGMLRYHANQQVYKR
jgi:hypothetical protein